MTGATAAGVAPHHSVAQDLEEKAARVTAVLRETYGRHSPRMTQSPTDSLIATILSQHTADRNSHAAFAALKERYTTWREIADADTAELADTIRSAGLANIKAARIQEALHALDTQYGTMDLAGLRTLPMRVAREQLRSLPGVGPKTAACVLLFSCGMPALPVDTHVHRVAGRLGLIEPGTSAEAAHDRLEEIVQPEDVYDFHVDLITHGRQVCLAREPRCGVCPLQELCDFYGNRVHPTQRESP